MEHDYDVANADGATFRHDLNSMAIAIVTQNAKATAPSTTFGNMEWYDTTLEVKKRRNTANTAWQAQRGAVASGTNFYVSSGGDDANNGLTSATAFKTISAAILYVSQYADMVGGAAVVQVLNGVYSGGIALPSLTGGAVTLRGNLTTPRSCQLTNHAGHLIDINNQRSWQIEGFRVSNTSGNCIAISEIGTAIQAMEFGPCLNAHMLARNNGSIFVSGSVAITGSAACFLSGRSGGRVQFSGVTFTFSGVIGFSSAFAWAQTAAIHTLGGCTFNNVNSTGGKRYEARSDGVIDTAVIDFQVSSQGYLPGVTAGNVQSGGIYV